MIKEKNQELLGDVLLSDVLNALTGRMTGTSEIDPHKKHLTVLPANCSAGPGVDQLSGVCSYGPTVLLGRTSHIGHFPAMVAST